MLKYILILNLLSLSAFAVLDFEDATSPELIKSARALGMGGAYLNKVDDGWSAFYNPAGLGSVRKLQFHLTNLHLEMNNGYLDATSGSGAFTDSITKYRDSFRADGIRDLLVESPGNSLARLQLFPNITYRYFTIGYMYHQQQRARLESLTSDFEVSERIDSGPVAAFNLSLFGGVLKLGASGVLLNRREIKTSFAPNVATNIESKDYQKGTSTYLTAGLRFTMPIKALPTFSVVYRNAGTNGWYDTGGAGAPDEIQKTYDASFSVTPIFSRNIRVHFEAALRDLTDQYDNVSLTRKVNLGMEIGFRRKMFVRFGYSDGWGSGGIGVRNRKFIFDLSTYAVEVGDGLREEEDRRFALSISSGL